MNSIVDPERKIHISKGHDKDIKYKQIQLSSNANITVMTTEVMQDNVNVDYAQSAHTVPMHDINIEFQIPVFYKIK